MEEGQEEAWRRSRRGERGLMVNSLPRNKKIARCSKELEKAVSFESRLWRKAGQKGQYTSMSEVVKGSLDVKLKLDEQRVVAVETAVTQWAPKLDLHIMLSCRYGAINCCALESRTAVQGRTPTVTKLYFPFLGGDHWNC